MRYLIGYEWGSPKRTALPYCLNYGVVSNYGMFLSTGCQRLGGGGLFESNVARLFESQKTP